MVKLNCLKSWLHNITRNEAGLALPMSLVMLTLGSLLLIPALGYSSTALKAEQVVVKKAKGLYAAEAGVEDAAWKIKYATPGSLPYSYTLTGINGMSVDVLIEELTVIAGQEVGSMGIHGGWLKMTKTVTHSSGIYYYDLTIRNDGAGNMKIEQVFIDLPPGVSYVPDSTTSHITSENPLVIGNTDVGITLFWQVPSPYYTINIHDTVTHSLQLSGPPGVEGVEGHTWLKATREDVGTVWDSDSLPYSITSQAKNAANAVVATVKTGLWKGTSSVEISCWQILP